MDYGSIEVAKAYLKGESIPDTEEEIRKKAYEKHKETGDFLAAHCFRLGKNYKNFTRENWAEVLQIEGRERMESNTAAYMACMHHGLL